MDSETTPLFLLASLCAALALAGLISRLSVFSFLHARKNRHVALDGLRGYLAFGVFILHFVITWHWQQTGVWGHPPEDYIWNIGRVAVYIFFMITGFLFVSKILANEGKTNWHRLYISRVFRIYPLYIFALVSVSFIVFSRSDWSLRVDPMQLAKEYLKWLVFLDGPINEFLDTAKVMAVAVWTLKYEWLFYLSLPLVAFILRVGNRAALLLVTAAILWLFFYPVRVWHFESQFLIFFVVGAFAAIAEKKGLNRKLARSRCASALAVFCLTGSLIHADHMDLAHLIMMSVFFFVVCLGNDMFGLLSSKASLLLGELSYSIYLIHGIVLFICYSQFNAINIGELTRHEYISWLMVPTGLLVVLVSAITFLLIEKPGMALTHKFYRGDIRASK